MHEHTLKSSTGDEVQQDSVAFYRDVLKTLSASGLAFLVGGAYALNCYTKVNRNTKDLDIFIRRQDYERVSEALLQAGYTTEMTYPHWLAKIRSNGDLVDLIFNSGNGIAVVDDAWFEHANNAEVLDVEVKISPVEEMIWSKAFVMERERYDGADVAHLLCARGDQLNWQRLLRRFDDTWRVLLSHLVLFGFAYPAHRNLVPAWIMDELLERLRRETHTSPPDHNVCSGTLMSREQYLVDIEQLGYRDARVRPIGTMSAEDTARWTDAIPRKQEP
jgi:predicted nucleotidyltransferase